MKKEIASSPNRIPAKLHLFGEWAVLAGHPAIGCTVGKYFTSQLEELPDSSDFIIESPEETYIWNQGTWPPFLARACEMLEFLFPDLSEFRGKKLRLERNWPLEEGLGSSSALFLSLALLERSSGLISGSSGPRNKPGGPIAQAEALRRELVAFQKSGSGFDLLLQSLGGFVCARLGEPSQISKIDLAIPDELILVHTGQKMKTDLALAQKLASPDFGSAARKIGASTESFLQSRDWEKTMREHHATLQSLGVVPQFVLALESDWRAKKWLKALKTTGAGGGDTLMVLINSCQRPEIEEDLRQRKYWLEEAPLGVPGALENA